MSVAAASVRPAAFRPPIDLEEVVVNPSAAPIVRLEPTSKRVRAFLGGIAVADSTNVQLMLEGGRLPVYYFPVEDVRMDLLAPGSRTATSPTKGEATYFDIDAGEQLVPNAAWRYPGSPQVCPDLSGLVAFHWRLMDAWYEEDEEVLAHARDPYKRIDVLLSTRHVRLTAGDTLLGDSRNVRMLFETGMPVRYYLPREDVRFDELVDSDIVSACAYKGITSRYWSQRDGALHVAWSYERPKPEVGAIAGLVCFFNERVDITVDGVLQERPKTPFS